MISDFSKAVGQLPDPRFRGVLMRSIGLAVVVLILLWVLVWWLLSGVTTDDLAWLVAWMPDSMATAATWTLDIALWLVGFGALLLASYLLFPPLMVIIMGLFLETIAAAVEDRHYPGLPPARDPSVGEALMIGLKFLGISLLVNLVALPFYFVPMLNLVTFCLVNGYLLSREFFELVAARRLAPAGLQALRKQVTGRILPFGVLVAFLFTIPVVNLVVPILATAAMVHRFQRLSEATSGQAVTPVR